MCRSSLAVHCLSRFAAHCLRGVRSQVVVLCGCSFVFLPISFFFFLLLSANRQPWVARWFLVRWLSCVVFSSDCFLLGRNLCRWQQRHQQSHLPDVTLFSPSSLPFSNWPFPASSVSQSVRSFLHRAAAAAITSHSLTHSAVKRDLAWLCLTFYGGGWSEHTELHFCLGVCFWRAWLPEMETKQTHTHTHICRWCCDWPR